MAKILIELAWLFAIVEFGAFATDNRLGERVFIDKLYDDLEKRQPSPPVVEPMPKVANILSFYALPVGQGDAQILQCPNGDVAIIDLGSSDSADKGFWSTNQIQIFLEGHFDKIKTIVITHNDKDHYNFFDKVFPKKTDLKYLEKIYISCTDKAMDQNLQSWINIIGAKGKLGTFNQGSTCGSSNGKACENIILCPGNPEIETRVLSANADGCTKKHVNIDSIVFEITFGNFKMQLNGDFEDATEAQKDGPQKKMVDFYGSTLQAKVYKLAHHGAECKANKHIMLDAVKPKAVFVSSNPWFKSTFRHPRCSITDYLEKSLCKPAETKRNNKFFCGDHPVAGIPLDYKLQREFTCGVKDPKSKAPDCDSDKFRDKRINDYAIYTTVPSKDKINLIHLLTDGIYWGFINDIQSNPNGPLGQ